MSLQVIGICSSRFNPDRVNAGSRNLRDGPEMIGHLELDLKSGPPFNLPWERKGRHEPLVTVPVKGLANNGVLVLLDVQERRAPRLLLLPNLLGRLIKKATRLEATAFKTRAF